MSETAEKFSVRRLADGKEFPISATLSVGRLPGNDVVLGNGKASRRHARLDVEGGRLFVTDLDSTNGTYLNGERIRSRTEVHPGNNVRFDKEVFDVWGPAAPKTELGTRPRWPQFAGVPARGRHGDTVIINQPPSESYAGPVVGSVSRPTLQIMSGPMAGAAYTLLVDDSHEQVWVVGQAAASDIVLADEGVSRTHAQIERRGSYWTIRNQLAANGVLVNSRPTSIRNLVSGDFIAFVPVQTVFLLPAAWWDVSKLAPHGLPPWWRYAGVVVTVALIVGGAAVAWHLVR